MQHCDGLALFEFSHSLVDRVPAWCLGYYGWKPDWDSRVFLESSLRHDDFYPSLVLKKLQNLGTRNSFIYFLEGCCLV